ncbi:hypothetical protein SDC9_211336 [bioreactor metagenome]|uniref:Uncharacterized protein n=1 Tax=bioreactor metagenome TaxID=1076179 RepID=A0A645JK04_9ZZZZ
MAAAVGEEHRALDGVQLAHDRRTAFGQAALVQALSKHPLPFWGGLFALL